MALPRQNCPVCGNSPRVFLERLKDAQIASLKAELEEARKRIKELAKQVAS